MDFLELIRTRRSIRKYTETAIPGEVVQELLRAAMYAPSATNEQPWQFIVINDRKILDEIPSKHPYAAMAAQAPLAIVVCGDLRHDKANGYWVQDCSAATQNLLLAAHSLGLGAVWCGIYPRERRVATIQKFLALPEHIIPLALVVIGHPAEQPIPEERFRPERVHYNGW